MKSHAYFRTFLIKSFQNKSKLVYASQNPKDTYIVYPLGACII